ncbi:MAG: hypothetical protein JSV40_00135 [Deltaproteobacteria bacterium]|nr:MAG: hypothetical protein JSV40_00135 [Deltaproteobacteria bacterium]
MTKLENHGHHLCKTMGMSRAVETYGLPESERGILGFIKRNTGGRRGGKVRKALSVTISCFAITGLLGCGHLNQARTYMEWDWAQDVSVKRILVVPLSFPGTFFVKGSDKIEQRFAGELPKYIRELSYGRVRVDVEITPWMEMPKPVSQYSLSSWRIQAWSSEDQRRRQAIVQDAAAIIDKRYDVSAYDGLFLVVGASLQAFGRNGYLARTLWGFFRTVTPSLKVVPPTDVHIQDCPFPSLAYALPKILGGYKNRKSVAPTLYDYGAQSRPGFHGYANELLRKRGGHEYFSIYVGPWDILSQHGIKTMWGFMPQGMTSFTKIRLGWIRPEQVITVREGKTIEVLLAPLWKGDAETLAVRIPVNDHLYYLVENRQRVGVDRHLPSEGVLILQVDENIPESAGPVRVMNAHPRTPYFKKAPFQVGEKYENREHGIAVTVLSKAGDQYLLEIVKRRGRSESS